MAGFDGVAEDEGFLSTIYILAQLALAHEDQEAAETILQRSEQYRDFVVVAAGPSGCSGPVALELGRLALLLGRPDEARAHLEVALALARRLQAPRWTGRAEAALRGLDARPGDLPAGLSKREAEVLGLLAAGLTNKEVAGRLHVGVRTVDSHVSSIYRKVGARRRGDAVAFAMAHGIGGGAVQDP
jgi:DNA-binding CsgD family transcriptional regulator